MTLFKMTQNHIVFTCDSSLCEVDFAWLQRSHWALIWKTIPLKTAERFLLAYYALASVLGIRKSDTIPVLRELK